MPADDLSDEQHYLDHARAELARMRVKTEALRDSAIGGGVRIGHVHAQVKPWNFIAEALHPQVVVAVAGHQGAELAVAATQRRECIPGDRGPEGGRDPEPGARQVDECAEPEGSGGVHASNRSAASRPGLF